MLIKVGKFYEVSKGLHGYDKGDLVKILEIVGKKVSVLVLPHQECMEYLETLYNLDLKECTKLSSTEKHSDANEILSFAKSNFTKKEVKGFLRISAIECLQSNERYNLESLNKASQYIQELISMESKQKELHT